jgi:hypothetical protein
MFTLFICGKEPKYPISVKIRFPFIDSFGDLVYSLKYITKYKCWNDKLYALQGVYGTNLVFGSCDEEAITQFEEMEFEKFENENPKYTEEQKEEWQDEFYSYDVVQCVEIRSTKELRKLFFGK